MNKCIKVILKKCLNEDMKEVKKIIKDFNYLSCKACNKGMSMYYLHQLDLINIKNDYKQKGITFNIKDYEKGLYGVSYSTIIQREMKKIMNISFSGNVEQLYQTQIEGTWKQLGKQILKLDSSIPNFKKETSYCFRSRAYELRNNGGWFVDLSFFSKEGLKERGLKTGHKYSFEIDKIDNNKKSTITKIINGEYKQGAAQISITDKGKIELIISFAFEPKQTEDLDNDKTLGVDLGITNIATMSIYDSSKDDWRLMDWKERVIDGKELITFREKYYNLRRNLSIGSKIVGNGRIGHGYKNRMKNVNKVRDKINRFSDTYNHKVSKYIVDMAIKYNCKHIQMEDLTGVTKDVNERFLKNWSYYDLQSKIEYKAKERGIDVIKIDPKYTSKRCSKCGNIHIDNRNCKENQSKFECKICGHTENADINASKNIAIPQIDTIIKSIIDAGMVMAN